MNNFQLCSICVSFAKKIEMPDILSPEQRHINMSHVRSVNTKPELELRHALWHLGYRYRINDKRLSGTPDIVLPKYHTVIFVHGCFWHGHKDCPNYTVPKTNADFWKAKVTRNQERDQKVWRQLEAKGWSVIIVWECRLKKNVFQDTVSLVEGEILRNGQILFSTQDDRRKAREEYLHERRKRKEHEEELKVELRNVFKK